MLITPRRGLTYTYVKRKVTGLEAAKKKNQKNHKIFQVPPRFELNRELATYSVDSTIISLPQVPGNFLNGQNPM